MMSEKGIKSGRVPLTMAAEWAAQSCVQLTWPHEGTDWAPMLPDITRTYVDIAVAIARRERLVIVSPRPRIALDAICASGGGALLRRIDTVTCDTDDTWARDHGMITLMDGNGRRVLLDFCFNGWGEKYPADKDNAISARLYASGLLKGDYEDHLDFVLEGGSIETDGKGMVFTTTACLTAPHRNIPADKRHIEEQLKRRLRAERVVWIDHGSLAGDDTDGHIDTLMRVAPDDTLLYVSPRGADCRQQTGLEEMERQITALRTTDGKPYRLLPLPLPRPIDDGEQCLPATYANYLVVNGAVLCPTYGQTDRDAEAMRVIAQAFPDREAVGIDCRSVIRQHGSLHCCTMQYY